LHFPSHHAQPVPPAGAVIFTLCPHGLAATKPPTLIRWPHETSMEKLVMGDGKGPALAGDRVGEGGLKPMVNEL
jgi:hypothetical protein